MDQSAGSLDSTAERPGTTPGPTELKDVLHAGPGAPARGAKNGDEGPTAGPKAEAEMEMSH